MANGILHTLYEKTLDPQTRDTSLITSLVFIVAIYAAKWMHQYLKVQNDSKKLGLINGSKPWSFFAGAEKNNYIQNASALFEEGFKTVGKAFRLQTDDGIQLVLSGEYADGIRDHPDLSFTALTAKNFQAVIPGFDAFKQGTAKDYILQTTIKENLTHHISDLNSFLSEEATAALDVHWGNKPDWNEISLKDSVLHIITQVSSRAFLGPELCRNQDWIRFVSSYGFNAGMAAQQLRVWPSWMRPVVHHFLPHCHALRRDLANCRKLVTPVLENRNRVKAEQVAKGEKPEKYLDAMEWSDQVANGRPYDAAAIQIMLAIVGGHSSSDALAQILFDLCDKPELVEDMRKEIIAVMTGNTWTKSAIYNLKLMDSVMKESQRLKPATISPMHRLVVRDTTLPDGTRLPEGSKIMVSYHQSLDNSIFPDADKFDGYRFLRLREEGLATAQYVSTSSSTMGFGHGAGACPGRFFANAEIKVVLSHILLKYDLKFNEGSSKAPYIKYALLNLSNPMENVLVRRREEEIDV